MLKSEKFLNQQVFCSIGDATLLIVSVIEGKTIEDLKVSFDNGKTFILYTAFINGIIRFIDEELQKEVQQEIDNYKHEKEALTAQKEENNRLAIEENKRKAVIESKTKPSRRNKNKTQIRKDRKNAAYKATYCDGNGDWFKAPCSRGCRSMNCAKNGGGRFCSTNSVCKKVMDGLVSENEIRNAYNVSFLCYESKLLLDYKIYAGRDDDGTVRGWSLDSDRLVILTTVKPHEPEEERVIFGVFLINHSYEKDDEEASATSYPECRLSLSKEESEQMKYWDYAPGEGINNLIQWKEGLLRYQTDEMCATVLRDFVKVIEKRNDPQQTEYARNFLKIFLQKIGLEEEDIPEKQGARIK